MPHGHFTSSGRAERKESAVGVAFLCIPMTGIQTRFKITSKKKKNGSQKDAAKHKEIDDWLLIASSRNAKWWYSAFHNVTAMVGANVLSLPYAMSHLGWGPGVTILILSWVITLYTLWQMVEMHEMVPGKRFDRYHELGQYAFGEKLGLWIVLPQQLIVEVGEDIVYMVTGGKSLKKFHDSVCLDCKEFKTSYFIMIFASVHFVISHLPNFNSISIVSMAVAVMSLSYVASAGKGVKPDVDYSCTTKTTTDATFNFFNALGDIQATIPSTPAMPSKGPMWKRVFVAYIVVAICYFPVALIGYWIFGNIVYDNILITLEKPAWLIVVANIVENHIGIKPQIFAMPMFDMLETFLVKKLNFKPSFILRSVTRTSYVAIAVPFFRGLLYFFGGFAFALTRYTTLASFPVSSFTDLEPLVEPAPALGQFFLTCPDCPHFQQTTFFFMKFFIFPFPAATITKFSSETLLPLLNLLSSEKILLRPCIMWLLIYKPKKFSLSWITNWICIVLGVMLMILSPTTTESTFVGDLKSPGKV
ncbi:hypothetical protein I3843_05G105500 [Carya illinoinensis]|nr:hypothetical protein I3843_05G105500 [Carya illinoinensis]